MLLNPQMLFKRIKRFPFCNWISSDVQEILYGASIVLILQIFGVVFSFGVNIALARSLGTKGTGIYYLAMNVCALAVICGGMGLERVLMRYTASNAVLSDWKVVKGVYLAGVRIAVTVSVIFMMIIFLLSSYISNFIFQKPELSLPLQLMVLSIVPRVLVIIHSGSLKGLKRIPEANFISGVGIPLLALIGIPLLSRFWGVNGAALAYSMATIAMMITGIYMWRKTTSNLQRYEGYFSTRKLISTSMPLLAVQLINLIISSSSTYIIGIWLSSSEIGVFNVAYRTAMLISFPLLAVKQIAAPKFAEVHDDGDISTLERIACDTVNVTAITGFPIFLFFTFFSEKVMGIFGTEFSEGYLILLILSIAHLVNAFTGPVGLLLIMRGYERLRLNIMIISAVLNIFLKLFLIRYYGLIGVALAFVISASLTNISYVFAVRYRMKIWVFPNIQSKLIQSILAFWKS